MKNYFLTMILFINIMFSSAAIRIVDNSFGAPTVYSSIQSAIDASSPNDTIYIQASSATYQSATLTIPLVLIGEGALPNQQMQRRSAVTSIALNYNTSQTTSASGTKIYGLHVQSLSFAGSGNWCTSCIPSGVTMVPYAVGNVSVERCYLKTVTLGDGAQFNLSMRNNIINELYSNSYYTTLFNCDFSNNIIMNTFSVGGTIYGSGNNFSHNTCFISSLMFPGANVIDNLFDNSGAYSGQVFTTANSYAYFHHNVFGIPLSTQPNGTSYTNFGVNQFVSNSQVIQGKPSGSNYIDPSYTSSGPFWNLHFNATAIGGGYASDQTDVGIYGGFFPWVDEVSTDERFRYFAAPKQLPVLQELNILTPNITPNGTLNIQFKAKTQN